MVQWLVLIALIVVVFSLFYTLKVGKVINARKGEFDTETKTTRRHSIMLNPIFLAYIIALGGLIIFVAYLTLSSR
ncbi:hypothetical protein [Aquibacillus saliphilus]|uniref:hypothetical protein n=1 Tax=Aquibacillus saliphilus TaxID=1909422 RepID=UPI001CF0A871|nr:hypothetical protein [Aquibacillus saliphilus]